MINPPEFEYIELFEQEAMKEESKHFSNIFRLDIERNKLYPYRLSDFLKGHYKDRLYSILDYRQMLLSFVLERVEESERDNMIQKLLPERLSSYLKENNELEIFFSEAREEQIFFDRLIIKRLGDSTSECFVGIESSIKEPISRKKYHLFDKNVVLVGSKDEKLNELLRNKYVLFEVNTLEEAIDEINNNHDHITVVFIGNNISEADSISLLKYVKNNDVLKFIPVIMSLLPEWENSEADLFKLGASEVIYAPYCYDVALTRLNAVISHREVKEIIKATEKDPATGFLSRDFFFQYSRRTLHAQKNKEYYFVIVEIDNFQVHLDKYTEIVGDLILKHVATVIENNVQDIVHIGRISDDQIAFLREAKPFDDHNNLIEAVKENSPIPNLAIKVAVSTTKTSRSIKILSKDAEIALSKIKQQYGVSIAVYNESMELEKQKELRILSSMEAALEKGQFSIYYQPKFEAATGKICGAEALVRWMHPEYGFMNPNDFIPLFERVGFIRGLDRFIFARVCQDIVRWKTMGFELIPISVNLSRRDFETGDLADWILNLLDTMGIPHNLIHTEITESAYTYNPELIASSVEKLHDNGVVIELDDFGIGYSSLTMLNRMPIDILKIEKEIVQQDKCDGTRSILDFCVVLAKVAGYQTVVEGIENETQLNRVRKLGCNYVQGFLYSRPIPVGEFEIFWKTHL